MNQSLNMHENEESLDIASKDWNRIINVAKKAGYREGIESGSDSVFQEGFDKGYEEGFKNSFILGKFKSLLNVSQVTEHPQDIKEILDKTKRGACNICLMESKNVNYEIPKPFPQVIDEQRKYSMKVIQRLCEYFQPHVKKLNINESNVLEISNNISNLSKDN